MVTEPTTHFAKILLIDSENLRKKIMRVKYQWHIQNKKHRTLTTYLLLNEVDKQRWYSVIYLKLWKSVGLICTQ